MNILWEYYKILYKSNFSCIEQKENYKLVISVIEMDYIF